MKVTLFFFFSLNLITPLWAQSEFRVLLRKKDSVRTYYQYVKLSDLMSRTHFEGKYFKIVRGKSDQAISFEDQDKDLLLKAATSYYHLTQAKNFWIKKLKSRNIYLEKQMIVRLEITNEFNELGHFSHHNLNPQYNNALSIPAGKTPDWVPEERQKSWGNEIWFRPIKKILTTDLGPLPSNPLTQGLTALENPLLNYTRNEFENSLLEELFYPAYAGRPFHEDIFRFAGTFALMKVVIFGSKFTDRLFVDKYFYLDTAMIPEVIYHEYAHVALSDFLEMSHSTPVNEGMADYFAALGSQVKNVYSPVPGRSNAAPKNKKNKNKYSHWYESNRQSSSDFTLSVLWDVRETLGEEVGDKVVFEARKYLETSSSTISHDLLRALLKACQAKCPFPVRDKLKLYQAFRERGF